MKPEKKMIAAKKLKPILYGFQPENSIGEPQTG
jgi:hypothetical protein